MQFSFSKEGDLLRLRQLYDKDENIIHQVFGKQSKTLLHLSVENKRIDMVTFILEKGTKRIAKLILSITINTLGGSLHGDLYSNTPLHSASKVGETKIIDILVKHGAELDGRNSHGETPLHVAAGAGQTGK